MAFYDLFDEAYTVLLQFVIRLDSVYITLGQYNSNIQFSLLEILEMIFGVEIITAIATSFFTRKARVEV